MNTPPRSPTGVKGTLPRTGSQGEVRALETTHKDPECHQLATRTYIGQLGTGTGTRGIGTNATAKSGNATIGLLIY